jgi:TonB family protein
MNGVSTLALSLFISLCSVSSMLAGCRGPSTDAPPPAAPTTAAPPPAPLPPVARTEPPEQPAVAQSRALAPVSGEAPGDQTALDTAAVPFASYVNGMHKRIHRIFAESFLGSLHSLPRDNPMNDPTIFTRVEIVLRRDGRLLKMGIVKGSGVTAFDIAALDSVQRATPFGPAPSALLSPDGNMHLHWEFHRDEVFACSATSARPFIRDVPAKPP